MWSLDARTLVAMNLLLALMFSATLYAQRRTLPQTVRGYGEWIIATLGGALTSGMLVAREVPYGLLSSAVVNTCLLGISCYYYAGTCRFVGVPSPHRLLPWLLLGGFIVFACVLASTPYQVGPAAFGLVTMGLVTALHIRVLRTTAVSGLGAGCLRVALWCTLAGLIWRVYIPLANGNMVWTSPPIAVVPTSAAPALLFTLSFVLTSMAFVMMGLDRVHQTLELLAARDPLTDTLNRRAFIAAANLELERSRRYGTELAVLEMDLDHFKRINDTYGHQAGDRVLVDFARRVAGLLRSSDIFGRFGGEEFVILLTQTTAKEAYLVAERIRSLTAEATGEPRYTVSIGVVARSGGSPALEELIAEADAALYRAKHGGRNRVEFTLSPGSAEAAARENPAATD